MLGALAQAGVAPSKYRMLAVRNMPHSGKPDELVDAFGISAKHIAAAVREIAYESRDQAKRKALNLWRLMLASRTSDSVGYIPKKRKIECLKKW